VTIALLLLSASASREFGLAFAAGVAVSAVLGNRERRVALLAAAAAPVAAFLLLRALLAGFSVTGYCETMGFPGERPRIVCYGDLDSAERARQFGWNALAGFLGTFLPPVIDPTGTPLPLGQIPRGHLIVPAITLVLAAVGLRARPRVVLALLAVVVASAVLNFELFRARNQLAGALALDAAAGIGFVALVRVLAPRRAGRVLAGAAACAILVWLGTQASHRSDELATTRASFGASDPCDAMRAYPRDVDPSVTRMVIVRYGRRDAACERLSSRAERPGGD
jgi:hypothetical protein